MKILAINGSPRKGKNTAKMLLRVLAAAEAQGAETELLELSDYNIKQCKGCNTCLKKDRCSIQDDDNSRLHEKLLAADGIVLGSPVFFANVSGLMKTMIDRSRCLHMVRQALKGKVGGAVVHAGLRYGGQELALQYLEHYLRVQGLFLADAMEPWDPVERTLFAGGAIGGMLKEKGEDRLLYYRSIEEDPLAMDSCTLLGQNIVQLWRAVNK